MTARDAILQAVRAVRPAEVPLPDVRAATFAFSTSSGTGTAGDLAARFAEAARASGARVVDGARAEAARLVAAAYPEARRVASAVADVPGTMPRSDVPHDFADADLFVCEAVLGVAENGAVWLPASRLGPQRAALFLATHVAVLLDRTRVVPDFHAAYAILDPDAEAFGAFVAGPSKTADIEQSLVVGAHGPVSLTLVLVGGG